MKHLKTLISAMVLFCALSCSKDHADCNGQVSFEVESMDVIADVTKSNVSDYATLPSSGDFTITITDANSSEVWTGKISEWNAETLLLAGTYTVEAVYGSIENEGFGKPYFVGSNTFSIEAEKSTTVSIPVNLGNTVIKFAYSDTFKKYYTDYSFKLTRGGSEIATFSKAESRAVFVDGYKIAVEGTLKSETKTQTFYKEYTGLDAATAYTLTFDVPNVGGASLEITFNNSVEEVVLGDIELNE